MATDQKSWKLSKGPAYYDEECYSDNLNYEYSEVDCNVTPKEKYKLTNVKLIDFWGEGYIRTNNNFVTGFRDAYNINHQYQLVSNGPNRNRKIPNRIPVKSYSGYDLKPYINDSAAKYVTLMGAPIDNEAYLEISRILRKQDGVFIFFSDETGENISYEKYRASQILEKKYFFLLDIAVYKKIEGGSNRQHISIPIGFVYMAADKILKYIVSETEHFFDKELADLLYNFYRYDLTEHWKKAVDHLMRKDLDPLLMSTLNVLCMDNKRHDCVSQFLNYMKKETNILFYIQESSRGSEYQYLYAFFEKWEPNMTKVLFGGKYATITNLEFEMPLKLPKKMVDKDKDKPVYGGSRERGIEAKEKERFLWRITPINITKNETIISIFNVKFEMPLKLPKKMVDKDKDKPAFCGSVKRGIESDSRNRFYWEVGKVKYYGMDFYTLTNVEYGMPLKLPIAMVDKDDDKPAYGGSAERKIERNQERRFYWIIKAVGDYVV